jgi:hypothetical protein
MVIACIWLIAAPLCATTATESWEGDYTVLGMYGSGSPPIIAEAVASAPPDPIHGLQTLQLMDNSPSGTPQAYVAWIRGLVDGDQVTACIWRYDTTPGASPSCRIWAHWNDDPADINGYSGSAGGNADYGLGEGWDQTCWDWTVDPGDPHTGIVIEVRTYSEIGDTVWVDYLEVTAPDHAEIIMPVSASPVEGRSWTMIKGLYR